MLPVLIGFVASGPSGTRAFVSFETLAGSLLWMRDARYSAMRRRVRRFSHPLDPLDPGGVDDLGPFVDVGGDAGFERVGARGARIVADQS